MSVQAPAPDCAACVAALRDPAVRDLAWLLFSPDLLQPHPRAPLADLWETPQQASASVDWLVALDKDAGALHRALDVPRLTRVGRYAEELLGWFLLQGPTARLVAANVALRRAGRTLGECDFLVETSGGRRLHWELAVKCYLQVGDGRGRLSDFVGPNLRDRFDRKLSHLLDHQLRLSARDEFATLGLPGPWLAQMMVKGWLFYRAGEEGGAAQPRAPAELASAHPRGWWVTHADWNGFAAAQAADGWSVLPRLDWLAPKQLRADDALANAWPPHDARDAARARTGVVRPVEPQRLFERLARSPEPVMVAAFAAAEDGGYRELSRGFVVPDDWPARAHAFAHQ